MSNKTGYIATTAEVRMRCEICEAISNYNADSGQQLNIERRQDGFYFTMGEFRGDLPIDALTWSDARNFVYGAIYGSQQIAFLVHQQAAADQQARENIRREAFYAAQQAEAKAAIEKMDAFRLQLIDLAVLAGQQFAAGDINRAIDTITQAQALLPDISYFSRRCSFAPDDTAEDELDDVYSGLPDAIFRGTPAEAIVAIVAELPKAHPIDAYVMFSSILDSLDDYWWNM